MAINPSTGYLGNTKIKKEGIEVSITAAQKSELLKCMNDPIYFAKTYVHIFIPSKRKFEPFPMRPYQERMMTAFIDNKETICKMPRQSGKTTTAVAFFLWCTLFQGAFKIAILANKHPLARDILKRYQEAYERLPKWMQQGVKVWNKGDIELENGAKIKTGATTSSSIRGETFNLVFLDEFAHIDSELANEFFQSVHPTLAEDEDSKMVIVSTPKGLNHFYKLWVESVDGKSTLTPLEIKWNDVPGRDEEFRKKIIASYGEDYFEQEYATSFIGGSNTLIRPTKLQMLTWTDPINDTTTSGGLSIFEEKQKGRTYAISVDVARGVGGDYSAFIVVDITNYPHKVVAAFRSNTVTAFYFPVLIHSLAKQYNDAYVLVETNDLGEHVAWSLYHELEYENIFSTSVKEKKGTLLSMSNSSIHRLGIKTTKSTKNIGCTNLKTLIEADKLIINDHRIFNELSNFVSDGKTFRAVDGEHDDMAMCLVLHAWMTTQDFFVSLTDENLREKIMGDSEWSDATLTPFGFIDSYYAGDDERETSTSFI